MTTGARNGTDVPLPTRGSRCLDWWEVPDLLELAAIRAQVARFDVVCERIAAEIQREETVERRQREQTRKRRGGEG